VSANFINYLCFVGICRRTSGVARVCRHYEWE